MKLLSAIVEWSLANRLIVLAGTFIFVLYGINAARHLKIDAVPDVTTIQVQVITSAPALSPLEIEQYVTFAVERTMAGIPRVEEVRSVSRYGLSVVTIVFKDGTDIFHARQMVGERLKEAGEA
ncbi:MAG TPA: efflux RND transporter permease subunit, partial [Leptospiraceae bacterium]|nr:efflux RND transporter permease subunit [Leptospiraceae bacterium]